MTLMPVSNISRLRLQGVEVGRWPVDFPPVIDLAQRVGVQHVADHVEDVPQHGVAHRDGDARGPGCGPGCPAAGRRWA